jgi:hypothetical protein
MGTINKEIAEVIIANNGYYPGDPRVKKIVTYNNQFNGGLEWALVGPGDDLMRYEKSPASHKVKVIWQAK